MPGWAEPGRFWGQQGLRENINRGFFAEFGLRWSILVPGLAETWPILVPRLGRRWSILVPGWAETWPVLGPVMLLEGVRIAL